MASGDGSALPLHGSDGVRGKRKRKRGPIVSGVDTKRFLEGFGEGAQRYYDIEPRASTISKCLLGSQSSSYETDRLVTFEVQVMRSAFASNQLKYVSLLTFFIYLAGEP